jgi:ABC-type nitrate/sulfonate/bicarbonate transport system permease component
VSGLVSLPSAGTPARRSPPRPIGPWLGKAAFLLLPLAAWHLLVLSGKVGPEVLPRLDATLLRLAALIAAGDVPARIGETLTGWAISLVIATATAVPLGILLGSSAFARQSSRLLVDALRSVPPLGLIPLALLLFGARRQTELMVTVPTMLWPIMLQVSHGVRDIDPMLVETGRAFRLPKATLLRHVLMPAVTPYLITGLRLAAVMGLLLCIGIEVLTYVPGVGAAIAVAQSVGAVLDVYAYTLVAIGLGVAMTLATYLAEGLLVPWSPARRTRP